MFEPQDQQLGKGQNSQAQPIRPRPPQPRLPAQMVDTAAPHDLPVAVSYQAGGDVSQNERETLPEDIFMQTDNIPVASKDEISALPASAALFSKELRTGDAEMPAPVVPSPLLHSSHTRRKVIVFMLGAFIVAFLLIAGYLAYRILQAREAIRKGQPAEAAEESMPDAQNNTPPSSLDATADGPVTEETEREEQSASEEQRDENPPQTNSEPDIPPKEETPPPPKPPEPPKDSDGDGLLDIDELQIGSHPKVIDSDFDGIDDYSEARIQGTNPLEKDTDGDGLIDGEEIKAGSDPKLSDTDGDGVNDYMELKTYKSNPKAADSDGDGYDDGQEIKNGYSPIGTGKL